MTHITTLRDLRACIQADTAHSPATEPLAALDAAIVAMGPEGTAAERAEFEKLCRALGADTTPNDSCGYANAQVNAAWLGWRRHPALAQPVADEREAFEAWVASRVGDAFAARRPEGRYVWDTTEDDWRVWRGAWAAALAAPQPAAMPLTDIERSALEGLLQVALTAFHAADDSEDDGAEHIINAQRVDMDRLGEALDMLDELPDDQPGYVMAGPARARWALRRLLDAAQPSEQAQPVSWAMTASDIQALAAELVDGAMAMGGGDEDADGGEPLLVLTVARPGTVRDDDGALNTAPVLTIHLDDYPQEGVYPIDPANPTHDGQAPTVTTPGDNAAAESPGGKPNRTALRALVDLAWNEATSSAEVPSTAWADRLIDSVFHPGQAQQDADDSARLDWLRDNSCDLRCIDVPTGGDDSDVHWVVIEHHMAKPHEREIGRSFSDEPREAIDAARQGTGSVNG